MTDETTVRWNYDNIINTIQIAMMVIGPVMMVLFRKRWMNFIANVNALIAHFGT